MTKKKHEQKEHEVFEQTPDARGRIRLDRPLTSDEAAAQDEENRKVYLENRKRRFVGRR